MTNPKKARTSRSDATKLESPTLPEICFYRANERPYGAFSNLYRRAMVFEGRTYPTAEHAYQAGKARKEVVREWILSAPTPSLVAMAAHGLYTWDIAPNWSRAKFDRMREVLRAKFTQHLDLRELLISTGDAPIVEVGRTDNAVNRLWGQVNGKGQNMLGVLLMEVRSDIRDQSKMPNTKKTKSTASTKARRASGAITASI